MGASRPPGPPLREGRPVRSGTLPQHVQRLPLANDPWELRERLNETVLTDAPLTQFV